MVGAQDPGTTFEKPRGVSKIEVRSGYAQVHLGDLGSPLADARLAVLKRVADAGISIDFLKLTPGGLSFLVQEAHADDVTRALSVAPCKTTVTGGRSIVLVYAANLRDEEGLLAKLVSIANACGVNMEHVSDMHDRMLLVTDDESARTLADRYQGEFSRSENR